MPKGLIRTYGQGDWHFITPGAPGTRVFRVMGWLVLVITGCHFSTLPRGVTFS